MKIYNWRFTFLKDTLNKEYDGTVVAAPDEDSAWDIFLTNNGKFYDNHKGPDANQRPKAETISRN
jgi:hypothetical protein